MGTANRKWCVRILLILAGGLFGTCGSAFAAANQLVILTTFSREPLLPLIEAFSAQHQNVDIQIVDRRTQSSIQLLNKREVSLLLE